MSDLILKAQKDSTLEDQAVRENMGLVYYVVRRYFTVTDDAISIGTIGLLKAIRGFDPEKGAWSTCAYSYILNEVRNNLAKFDRYPLHIPKHLRGEYDRLGVVPWNPAYEKGTTDPEPTDRDFLAQNLLSYGKRNRKIIWYRFAKEETLQEIGNRLNLSRERIRQIIKELGYGPQ